MAFTLPPLDYPADALAPTISAATLAVHHGKHHANYVAKLNELVADSAFADAALDQIVTAAPRGPLFNNAAQHWNHSFYWRSMTPNGGGRPSGALAEAMDAAFGSVDDCLAELTKTAETHFASGWVWLAADQHGNVEVVETADADNPLRHGRTPLLTIDVWEHAYYLDHQNVRADYVAGFFAHLANWRFAADNLTAALSRS